MFKFIHAADIHLDSPLRGLQRYEGAPVEEIRLATRRAFENLVRLALDEKVAFVLVAGDLYDGDWEDCNTSHFFTRQVTKLRDAGIPVLLIRGNHDAQNNMTRTLPLPDNVRSLPVDDVGMVELPDWDVVVHGRGFANRAVKDDLSLHYPQALRNCFNIGLLHTSATGREGHEPYAPCTVEGLESKQYDYWALGHIHQREFLDPQTRRIVFPGNVQGRNIRETGAKGCMLVTVDDRRNVETEFRPLDVMRWERCRVDAGEAETNDDILAAFSQELQKLLDGGEGRPLAVRVEITGRCQAHEAIAARPDQCVQELRSIAIQESSGRVWVEKVKLLTARPHDADESDLRDGPVGELAQFIEEIGGDEARLRDLSATLADLKKKLPADLLDGLDAAAFDDADWIRGVLQEVEPLLVGRLLQGQRNL